MSTYAIVLADGSHLTGWTDIEVDHVPGRHDPWVLYAVDSAGDRRELRGYTRERAAREARWRLLARREAVRRG